MNVSAEVVRVVLVKHTVMILIQISGMIIILSYCTGVKKSDDTDSNNDEGEDQITSTSVIHLGTSSPLPSTRSTTHEDMI